MKDEIKKELLDLGSSLEDKITPQRPPLPEDYFTRMQESVLSEIDLPQQTVVAPDSFWVSVRQFFAPRTVLVMTSLAAIVFFIFIIKPSSTEDSLTFANLDENSTALYIDNYIDEFDVDLLSELFAQDADLNFDSNVNEEEFLLEEALDDLDLSELEELL